jgi:NTP pyrophosphatase (non-canonical NTP hydrolase)
MSIEGIDKSIKDFYEPDMEQTETAKLEIGKLNLNQLASQIHEDNVAKGFYEGPAKLAELVNQHGTDEDRDALKKLFGAQRIALMHSELSEGLEGHRKDLQDDHLSHRTSFEVELADTLIRILDACGHYNIDIQGAVEEKLNYNRSRPYKHGKKY